MQRSSAIVLIGLLVLCIGGGAASGYVGSPGEWYRELAKPDWTPPGWLFGPVWTALYALMAISAWLVWRQRDTTPTTTALAAFAIQLALNFSWSPLFFGLQRPDLGFAAIVLLLAAIAATILLFASVSRLAAWMLAPYLGWVCFAAALNFAIWRLNW